MMHLLVLSIVLTGSGLAQTQAVTREDLKKPLSEPVEKALTEFVASCVPEKQKQLTAHMEGVIKAVAAAVKLTPDETAALQQPAQAAVTAAMQTWQPLAVVMMRTYLNRNSDMAALRHIAAWKPEVAAPNEPIEDWELPDEDAGWLAALKARLGEARFAVWQQADAAVKKQADAEIAAYLERWGAESRGPMNEDLRARIELMKQRLKLPEGQVTELNQIATALLDRLTAAEKKRVTAMLRTLTAESRQQLMGRSSFYIRFDRPRGTAWDQVWEAAAAAVLTSELMAQWQQAAKEERDQAETELAEMIKPSEQQAEQRMSIALTAEIDNIVAALSLTPERQKALEKLSKEAVQASLKLARQGWLQQARNYSNTERQRIRGNVYFGINEEQQASVLPVWQEGLKKLLTEAERTRMATENKQREERTLSAIARACLAEMDKTLALNDAQREKLEPLLLEQMQPLLEQRRQQYWSYSATQLFQSAGKAREASVRDILDDVQWGSWKKMTTASGSPPRNNGLPDMNGSGTEVPDMEAAISAHMYSMFVEERLKLLGMMMPQVEDATRVLKLPEATVARLTTAAKGAVEDSLAYWRQNTERYVRQSAQTATPRNILVVLAGTRRVNFSRNESGPENTELWQSALSANLNATQLEQLQQVVDARRAYRLQAMAAMSATELDRRRKLTKAQCSKLETAIQQVLSEYLPDIERYMSHQWFLQYYYALVPAGGVPEKTMLEILTPEQWKLCKERDLPDALQYWEGIKNNHEQRLKQGAKGNQ